jgi:hypothetical protein
MSIYWVIVSTVHTALERVCLWRHWNCVSKRNLACWLHAAHVILVCFTRRIFLTLVKTQVDNAPQWASRFSSWCVIRADALSYVSARKRATTQRKREKQRDNHGSLISHPAELLLLLQLPPSLRQLFSTHSAIVSAPGLRTAV